MKTNKDKTTPVKVLKLKNPVERFFALVQTDNKIKFVIDTEDPSQCTDEDTVTYNPNMYYTLWFDTPEEITQAGITLSTSDKEFYHWDEAWDA